jgi:RNA polymerase sigma-70 factor (ECF subfamily)
MLAAIIPQGRNDSTRQEVAIPPSDSQTTPERTLPFHEQLLVLRSQQGDRDAFTELVTLYDRRLLYFIRRLLGEAEGALDVLQSVWLIVHRQIGRLQSPQAFRVWLYRIAHDQGVSELRRRSKFPIPIEDIPDAAPTGPSPADDACFENVELVHRGLEQLTVDHRRVLTLRFLEEMSIDEIAQVIGENPGTVKSRLHYARHALRLRIEEMTHD